MGRLTFIDGTEYQGNFANGKEDGRGKSIIKTVSFEKIYDGYWK